MSAGGESDKVRLASWLACARGTRTRCMRARDLCRRCRGVVHGHIEISRKSHTRFFPYKFELKSPVRIACGDELAPTCDERRVACIIHISYNIIAATLVRLR